MRRGLTCLALSVALLPVIPGYAAAARPEVSVSRPVEREITDEEHFTGRTEASTTVEVRSRLTSYLEKVLFKDGADVKKGELLFQLDDRTQQAELEKTQAGLARADALLRLAEADLSRGKKLRETGAISAEELSKLTAVLDEARPALQEARAAVNLAKLDLDRTRIVAPISGRIGRTLLDAGNLATKDGALATIVVSEPLYVYFDVSEGSLPRLRRLFGDSEGKALKATVHVRLATDEGFSRQGVLDFVDNRVDPATGTLRVRAVMPNPKAELLPGMFVSVRVSLGSPRKALLVPSSAIARKDGNAFVLVVNDKNILEAKPVKVGPLVGGLQVIDEGLGREDWVVVAQPRELLKAGDEVTPRPEKTPPAKPLKEKPRPGGAAWRAPLPDFPTSGPSIVVAANYPGANARIVEEVVAAPIARQLNGLPGVSQQFLICSDGGDMRLTLTFKKGTDLDKMMALAAARIQAVEPVLPDLVRRGVTLKKPPAFLLAVALLSLDGSHDRKSLGKMGQTLRDELVRAAGVAEVTFYGDAAPSPRLHLDFDRDRLAALGLAMADVRSSVDDIVERAGQDAEKLAGTILKADTQGRAIRVRDVARVVEVEGFGAVTSLDEKPCTTLLVYLSAEANPRDTAKAVRDRLHGFAKTFPGGIEWRVIE